jgi:heat shock protein HslJ/membrane-bound inhibitor of C-type lysozyme
MLFVGFAGCMDGQQVSSPAPVGEDDSEHTAAVLACGGRRVTVMPTDEGLRLSVEDPAGTERAYDLIRVEAASGARYEAEGDPSTVYWSKGEEATVTVEGEAYPTCTPEQNTADENTADENTSDENTDDGDTPGEAFTPVFHAAGNEPSWGVDLTDSTMTFRTPEGSRTSPVQEPVQAGDSTRYVSEDGTWSLSILEQPCTDTMSGLRYPNTVRVSMDDRTMSGCGGDPAGLLQGETWVVEDIDGGGIIDRSRVTIEFGDDGRVSGMASCNQYSGRYTLTGETLTFSPLAATKKGCATALMQQETRVLSILEGSHRLDWTEDGALWLRADDGRTLTLRRG